MLTGSWQASKSLLAYTRCSISMLLELQSRRSNGAKYGFVSPPGFCGMAKPVIRT